MRRKAVASVASLIILGTVLLGLARAHLETGPRLTQIGYEENLGAWKTYIVFLEQGQVCQVDIIADASDIGRSYSITVIQVEEMRTLFEAGGPINGQVIPQMFPAEITGHYEIEWHDLNVTRITAYRVDEMGHDLIPRYPLSVAGVSALMAAIASFLGLQRNELFQGKKTRVFWWGLIIFGVALAWLFGILWFEFFLEARFFDPFLFFWPSGSIGPQIFGSFVFLFIGVYMMKSGAKKESEA
jgi:hypothetical protein